MTMKPVVNNYKQEFQNVVSKLIAMKRLACRCLN